jgi:hypothetical protein
MGHKYMNVVLSLCAASMSILPGCLSSTRCDIAHPVRGFLYELHTTPELIGTRVVLDGHVMSVELVGISLAERRTLFAEYVGTYRTRRVHEGYYAVEGGQDDGMPDFVRIVDDGLIFEWTEPDGHRYTKRLLGECPSLDILAEEWERRSGGRIADWVDTED